MTTQKKERRRLPLEDVDRAFWVALRQSWLTWASRLFIVKADTVARWHRDRFRRYWAKISPRRHPGRPRVDAEVRQLIRTMAQDGWGAPRIHAELTKLGFIISEKTVSRYLPRRPPQPDELKRWMAFLRNHKEDIAAMDLFTVPTASLRLLYGFFIIEHDRRHIVHFNATFHPTAAWVLQQLRDAFPYESAPQYLIFDRDSIFSAAVVNCIRAMGTTPFVRRFRAPGRTEPPSAGSAVVGESCSSISWSSARGISFASYVRTSLTTMKIVVTWGSTKTLQTRGRSLRGHHVRRRSWRCPVWAGSITDTSGRKQRKAVLVAASRSVRSLQRRRAQRLEPMGCDPGAICARIESVCFVRCSPAYDYTDLLPVRIHIVLLAKFRRKDELAFCRDSRFHVCKIASYRMI